MRSAALLSAGALWSALLPACAHQPEGPAVAAAAFGAALAHGDLRGAYALTSAELQHRLPFAAFAAGIKAGAGEPGALGERLVAEAPRIAPRVEIQLALGEQVPLVLEGGRWRVDAPVYELWGQGTPRAALRTFIRAVDERRYDVLLRLIPDRYRAASTADKLRLYWESGARAEHNRALLAELRAAVTGPMVESADQAHLPYAADREVRLVREGGEWKIEDLDQD
jgi:hypothetical protein